MRLLPVIIAILMLSQSCQTDTDYTKNWPAWRGPEHTGVAPESNPPLSWSESSNIKWKKAIPGKGFSTPIVWKDKVFLTTAIVKEDAPDSTIMPYTFKVLALSRENGELLWEKTVAEENVKARIHNTSSHISNSSLTDGKFLYAYFGSRGLFCLDFEGNIIWERDFGQMEKRNNFGEGSSPALSGNKIVILWDHEGDSEIYCLDKRNRQDIWKMERDEPSSWSTPLIVDFEGKKQVITTASNKVRSYELDNGRLIWECEGLTGNVTPHPVYDNGMVYVMSGYRGYSLMAIRLAGAEGDISGTDAIAWSVKENTSYVPSPLLVNNRIYFLRSNGGSLSCLDALSGEVLYARESLADLGTVYNSPVYASGRIYQLGGSGLCYILKEGREFEILSENKLDDSFSASPAIAGNELFLRGHKYLYCIADESE